LAQVDLKLEAREPGGGESLRYLLLAFTIYFAYRFIVNFLIPVVKTTRQVKKQFDSVREQQAFHQQAQQPHQRRTR
jgi:hypothetical protein